MDEVMTDVNKMTMPAGLLPFDVNPSYGIAIANAANCSKATGFAKMQEVFPDAAFFMVGDSQSDFLADDRVVQCAVGNASAGYKSTCAFVAEAEYTKGLAEVLQWIRSQV